MKSNSIGINKWAGEMTIAEIGRVGSGDDLLIAWQRSDGERAIETNGDPVFEWYGGFEEAWDSFGFVAQ